MEEDMIKKISVLLSDDMGIKKEDVYKYIKNGLEKSNEAKKETKKETKKESKEVAQIIEDMDRAFKRRENERKLKGINKKQEKILKEDEPIFNDYIEKRPNQKLHIVADIKENKYSIVDDNGDEIISRIIKGVENGSYKEGMSQSLVDRRRKELIRKYKYVDGENVKSVDTITYKLLEDYDKLYSTNYAVKYLKLMVINPHRKESESKEKYENKVIKSKIKNLKEMNIDFTYNTKGILFLKGTKLKDKIQYMKMVATQQKKIGAKVYSNFLGLFKNKNKMLEAGNVEDVKNKKNLRLSKTKYNKMKFKSFHMPKLNINVDKQKAKRYFGRTVMAGLAGLSLFGAIYKTNAVTNINNNEKKAIEYTMENNRNDNDFKKQFRVNIDQNAVSIKQEEKEEREDVKVAENVDNNIEQQNPVIMQLSNLVNNKWEINSGKYYSSPDGTGNSGYFKNYQEAVKVDLLNLLDENGNKICTISPDELNNLPEDIASQVKGFQYHVSNESTELGWNTDKQLEELNENDAIHSVQEEKDSDNELGE